MTRAVCFRKSCVRMASSRQERVETYREKGPYAAPDVLPRGDGDDGEEGGHHCSSVHHGQQQGQVSFIDILVNTDELYIAIY